METIKDKPKIVDYFGYDGIRYTGCKLTLEEISQLRSEWESFVKNDIPQYNNDFHGKGIVICAGGLKFLTCAWINIKLLRRNGCTLPVEIWYNSGELNEEVILELKKLNVSCKKVEDFHGNSKVGYSIKPFAILNSSFKEVLFLDADNNCISDPSCLFLDPHYIETGALFWPDFWKTEPTNPIWKIIMDDDFNEFEQESGQILVNKERCWKELNLCNYFNEYKSVYYKFILGDKDTFKFAWKALKTKYFMIPYPVGHCGYSNSRNERFNKGIAMVQHDTNGNILFIHQNLAKWDIVDNDEILWNKIKRFRSNAENFYYPQGFAKLPNGKLASVFDIDGDVTIEDSDDIIKDTELFCLKTLSELRESEFYYRFILWLYIARSRGDI